MNEKNEVVLRMKLGGEDLGCSVSLDAIKRVDLPTLLLINELQKIRKSLKHLGKLANLESIGCLNGKLDRI